MSEEKAAPAGPDARNLMTRVASAVVLVPLAIAAAWAGGWYWTALVTLCAIGLFVEWLMVTGVSGNAPLLVTGAAILAIAAPFLALRNVDIALIVLALGVVAVAFRSSAPRSWPIGGFLYAAAAQVSSIVIRLDRSGRICRACLHPGCGLVRRYGRLFCRPRHRRCETLAAG